MRKRSRFAVIVVFGSINLDLIFRVKALPAPGQTVAAARLRTEPGGKGANQAVAAARDGARVVFAGAVGADGFAGEALALMREAGVDLSRVAVVDVPTGCASICVDDAGENLIAVASGANLAARADQVEDALLGPDTTLLLQMEVDAGETAALIRRAKARGCRVILNLAPAGELAEDAWRAVDWLVANEDEAAWLLPRFQPAGLVTTLGAGGVRVGALQVAARAVEVVDTTAAGDCFTGVLAAGLDRGMPLEAALRRANAAAGLCCTRAGSQGSLPLAVETDAFS